MIKNIFFNLLFITLLSCKNDNHETKEFNYLALGDSYTIGESLDLDDSYPFQLKNRIDKIRNVKIIAKTGWTTGELIDTLNSIEFNNKYDFVSLLIGVNNQYRKYDISLYEKEFEILLNKAISYSEDIDKVFVLSIPDYGVTPFGLKKKNEISYEIDLYNQIKKRITKSYNIDFFDITDISRDAEINKLLIAEDSLHPSKKMYSIWVDSIYRFLESKTD